LKGFELQRFKTEKDAIHDNRDLLT